MFSFNSCAWKRFVLTSGCCYGELQETAVIKDHNKQKTNLQIVSLAVLEHAFLSHPTDLISRHELKTLVITLSGTVVHFTFTG